MATRIWLEQLKELIDREAQVVEVLPEDDYAPVGTSSTHVMSCV